MTLLLSLLAAIVVSVIWYTSESARQLKVGTLCALFWGASLMWFVDAVFEYSELREAYFTPAAADMVNDGFLGVSVIVLAMLIWLAVLFMHDPRQLIRKTLRKSGN